MKTQSYSNLLAALTALLMLALPCCGWAQFNFITNADNTITITTYIGSGGNVTIPGAINTYPVTGIGTNAFANQTSLTGVTIPDSITSIGQEAFLGCGLTSVTIPGSVTNIGMFGSGPFVGGGPFAGCSGLTNIEVDATNSSYASVGGVLFSKALTTLIQYPADLTGSYAIPDSVTSIGLEAFAGCSGLTSLTIGNGVTSIGAWAFAGCSDLASVAIPGSVTNISDGLFAGCFGLTNINADATNSSYASEGGVLFNKILTVLIQYPAGLAAGYAIPDTVTNIRDGAFLECTLTSVTIPNSVTSIGEWAFGLCSSLTSVRIPNSVTSIGASAFSGCDFLRSVTIGNSVASIGEQAFANCGSLHQAFFQGNAPSVNRAAGNSDWTVFYLSGFPIMISTGLGMDTVYYLPGTSGWGTKFGGWPTAEWYQPRPQILGSGYGLGTGSQGFQFTISLATNTAVVVEASTNLQDWTPISTNTLVSGTNLFWDPNWTHHPLRFYRVGVEQ